MIHDLGFACGIMVCHDCVLGRRIKLVAGEKERKTESLPIGAQEVEGSALGVRRSAAAPLEWQTRSTGVEPWVIMRSAK